MAYSNRSLAWIAKKNYDKALADCDAAIRLDAKFALAYNNRAVAYLHEKEYARAVADCDVAIRLDPNDATAFENAAWILSTCPVERVRNGKRAVELATKSCEMAGWKDPTACVILAVSCAEAGDFDSAIKYEEKAAALNPDSATFAKLSKLRVALYKQHKPYREE